jgi:DNA-binding NarL/FixJ family response regulator
VVVVSASDRASDVIRAIDLGAMGFVPKRSSNAKLHEALRMVMTGGLYVPPMMLGLEGSAAAALEPGDTVPVGDADLLGEAPLGAAARPEAHQQVPSLEEIGLTPRQTEVLALLLKGLPNKLIARELNLSVETVKDHVAAVLRALGVSSRTQAVLAVSQMTQGRASGRSAAKPPPRRPANAAEAERPSAPERPRQQRPATSTTCARCMQQTPATLTGNADRHRADRGIFWPWPTACAGLAGRGQCGAVAGAPGALPALPAPARRRRRHAAALARSWRRWCCCQGAMWGLAVWLFWGLGTPYHRWG